MKKAPLIIGTIAVLGGAYAFFSTRKEPEPEVQFNYAPVESGELLRSISATGQLVSLTTVDVKSKAGGIVVKLAVDEGSVVKKGDIIAYIDPADTEAAFRQAKADVDGAQARAAQAQAQLELQSANAETAVRDAQTDLASARIRLERAELNYRTQPTVTRTAIETAQANLRTEQANLDRLESVTIPQMRRDAQAEVDRTKAALDAAAADLSRQISLEQKGFVSGAAVDSARSAEAGARASHSVAVQRLATLDQDIQADLRVRRQALEQARARVREAEANGSQVAISQKNLEEARQAVRTAEIALQQARDNRIQIRLRQNELISAKASTVRSEVQLENAKVQLDSTTVVAPRDGVVTMKYLEEGTIIPPGTSTFSQGTSLVQLSDVTQLYVECAVDEADIGTVRVGQPVRIVTEAFPGEFFDGLVERVNPSATTANNITAVKVRVRVLPGTKVKILPGMNATCEFVTMQKKNVLIVPSQAVSQEDGKATVRVKTSNPLKPEVREIKIGEMGNEGMEVLEGLKEGEEVVTAEIDLAALRETQRRMMEVQQGGGLAGGGPQRGGARPGATRSGSGSGGGARR